MIIFAMTYFTLLTETGFFNTIANGVFRLSKGKMSIWAVMIMTVTFISIGKLTTSIATAYLVTFPLMMTFYDRIGFNKNDAMCLATVAHGATGWFPWGMNIAMTASLVSVDTTALAAAAMKISFFFIPVILFEILYLGYCHKKAGGAMKVELSKEELDAMCVKDNDNPNRRPKMFWINFIVLVIAIAALIIGYASYFVFSVATLVTILLNYPSPKQHEPIANKVCVPVMNMLILFIGISMYVGVFNGTGMTAAIAEFAANNIPASMGRYVHLIALALMVFVVRVVPYQVFNSLYPVFVSFGSVFGLNTVTVIAPFVNNLGLGTGASPLSATTLVGCGLLGIDAEEYSKRSVPIQAVANVIVIVLCVIFGVM